MRQYEIELLPITFEHIQKLLTLDFHHRDPFDRIIISQGLVENLPVVTEDVEFLKYSIKIVWDK
jgi:PIN domain nuclease of toxin-antitoxin system